MARKSIARRARDGLIKPSMFGAQPTITIHPSLKPMTSAEHLMTAAPGALATQVDELVRVAAFIEKMAPEVMTELRKMRPELQDIDIMQWVEEMSESNLELLGKTITAALAASKAS